jgi:chromosomal replication initiation ATPase DnaA
MTGREKHDLVNVIISTCCEYFNVTLTEVKSKSRLAWIVKARKFIAYFAMKHGLSSPYIAMQINKDHATQLYHNNFVEDKLFKSDERYCKYKQDITTKLEKQLNTK